MKLQKDRPNNMRVQNNHSYTDSHRVPDYSAPAPSYLYSKPRSSVSSKGVLDAYNLHISSVTSDSVGYFSGRFVEVGKIDFLFMN